MLPQEVSSTRRADASEVPAASGLRGPPRGPGGLGSGAGCFAGMLVEQVSVMLTVGVV